MNAAIVTRFVALAAIWGSSFLFMRITAPVVGSVWTAQGRLSIGAAVIFGFMFVRRLPFYAKDVRHYAVVGLFNCAIPYGLYALAAQILPAGYSAILNSLAPLWATLFGVALLRDALSWQRVLALVLGILGVALVAQPNPSLPHGVVFWGAIVGCVAATACYGFTVIYLKKYTQGLNAFALAAWSQAYGALALLPLGVLGFATPDVVVWTPAVVMSMLAMGVLCSGVALLIYYGLLEKIGGVLTSSVTFFIPLFGVLWGALFLHERLNASAFVGAALIVAAAYVLFRQTLSAARL